MFLKFRGLVSPAYIDISRRLLSSEIKDVLNTSLCFDHDNGNHVQLSTVRKNLNAVNLDLFVNNLSNHEDRSSDILDLLAKLRATKFANTCLESTHFGVVRHLLENLTIQEVVPVLLDRPKYGIFLNNFTAFAVTQTLHEENQHVLGLPLAIKLVLSEEIDSAFVLGFCLKASLEFLKKGVVEKPLEELVDNSPKGKVQEKKIRVKFLRNIEEPDLHKEIGKAILKIESKILEGNTKANANILGLVLTKNYSALDKALNLDLNEDVADICKKLLSEDNQELLANKIKLQYKTPFGDIIDSLLKKYSAEEPALLAEKQKQLLPIWEHQRAQKLLELENETARNERKQNIEVSEKEIAAKKDLLWFFDNEEKLDLEIYNKQVFYPKRWFGKKKKPRVVDEHYVPPQIRKIN